MAVAVGQSSGKTYQENTLSNVAMGRLAIALPHVLQRLWWHTKAYSVVIGILLLLGVSLVMLRLHSFYRDGFKRTRLSDNSHLPVNAHNN